MKLLDLQSFEELAILESPDAMRPWTMSFRPDGAMLAVFTNCNGFIGLWDLRAVRRRLAEMNLDWSAPAYSSRSTADDAVDRTRVNVLDQ